MPATVAARSALRFAAKRVAGVGKIGALAFGPPKREVRLAERSAFPALAAMLARAFRDDPVAVWSCPPQRLRERTLRRFFGIQLRRAARAGEVWLSGNEAAAALWFAPARWRTGLRDELWLATAPRHPRLLWRLPAAALGLSAIERAHPATPPHWYLAVLGTDPRLQGRGPGSAVLSARLERLDRERLPA